ncbi:MAG: hypothetical protein ICV59_03065, partial [Thermoleophilia bacterium]|nr:hypothetical protein [Thermoleophilia bacterium]
MRRLAPLCAAVLVFATAATAATIRGGARGDRLVGTAAADTLFGRGGSDALHGLEGADFMDGGAGRDVLRGGDGADRISVETDGAPDRVFCGRGRDIVTADEVDAA